jgi:hypothetical protein
MARSTFTGLLFAALGCLSRARASPVWTFYPLYDPLAVCLDGSNAGYYLGPPASKGGVGSFLIHVQGGGWCTSLDDCANRAGTHYGTSTVWTKRGSCPDSANPACWGDNTDGQPDGLNSFDPSVNPLFASSQHVVVPYCDGASFSGALSAPVAYNATLSLHFRGRYILAAVFSALAARHGLGGAHEVLFKGCSAGGMAVILHADFVGGLVRAASPGARFAASPGAGLFLDRPAFQKNASFSSLLLWAAAVQNVSGSVNAACAAAEAEPLRCFLPTVSLPYVATPLFLSNSLTDSCALEFLMELGCDGRVAPGGAGACSAAQLTYVSDYRALMLVLVRPLLSKNAAHGGFFQACWTHIVENDPVAWNVTTVEGQTQASTFAAWWRGARGVAVFDGEWGTNPTCSNRGGCD